MFLGRTFRQRLEPVRVVRHTILLGPLHHTRSHGVSHRTVKLCTVVDDSNHLLIDIFRQVLIHFLAIEHMLAEILARSLTRGFYV